MGPNRAARYACFAVGLVVMLSACTRVPDRQADASRPSAVEGATSSRWREEPGHPLVLDAAQSRIDIRVYRAGRLAHLGHNHVLEVSGLRGLSFNSPISLFVLLGLA